MIAARVKFLQSSGRIEWRQEVLRAVSSARRRNSFSGDSICSTHLLCQVHQFPNHGLFQKERKTDKALMMVVVLLVAAMMETRVSR